MRKKKTSDETDSSSGEKKTGSALTQAVCRFRDPIDTDITMDAISSDSPPAYTRPIYTFMSHIEIARILEHKPGSTASASTIDKFVNAYFNAAADGRPHQLLYSISDGYGLFYYAAGTNRRPSPYTFTVESRVIIHSGVWAYVVKSVTEGELRQRVFENPSLQQLADTADPRADIFKSCVTLYKPTRVRDHRYVRDCANAPTMPVAGVGVSVSTAPPDFTVPPGTKPVAPSCHYAACSSVVVESTLKVCSECKCARYCSVAHSVADWGSHKFSCPMLPLAVVIDVGK
jgi:hypothetical protein